MNRLALVSIFLLLSLPAITASARFSDDAVAIFAERYGTAAKARLLAWQDLMEDGAGSSEEDKRVRVNRFFNRVKWVSDLEAWGMRDYWATPMEMLGRDQGDCEDYSIAKYFTLTEMDVPRGKLLITYVRAVRLDIAHMVLAWYPTPDADPFILDNLDPEIRRGSERPDLIPVYSFNADGLWQAVQRGRGRPVGAPSRIEMWTALLERMGEEGTLAGSKGFDAGSTR